jgi:hypothetical protein
MKPPKALTKKREPNENSLKNLKPFGIGNPGRPKGAKSKFTEDFWKDLHDAWETKGKSVIERVISEDPAKFLAVAASMLPKEVEVTNRDYVIVVPAQAESVDEWLSQGPMSASLQ